MNYSALQTARYQYQPKLPLILQNRIEEVEVCYGEATQSVADQEKISQMFPNTYEDNLFQER